MKSKVAPVGQSGSTTTEEEEQLTRAQMRWKLLWLRAQIAALKADEKEAPRYEGSQALDCGYAWVTLADGRSGFSRYLRKCYPEEYWEQGHIRIYVTRFASEQSVDLHRSCAEALARVLKRAGVKCSVEWCFD